METKLNTKQKLVFIFLLILGNAIMAMLTFFSGQQTPIEHKALVTREDYVSIRISARLRAELNPDQPVTLIGLKTKVSIPNAFIIKEFKKEFSAQELMRQKEGNEYLISVHKTLASAALGDEDFNIYPNGVKVNHQKRKNYEVFY